MSEWISVKDRLPPEQRLVIVHRENGTVTMSSLEKGFGCLMWSGRGWEVTHWMSLPEPPKEETE